MREVTYKIIFSVIFGLSIFVIVPEILYPSVIITRMAIIAAILIIIFGVISNYYQSQKLRLIMLLSLFFLSFSWSLHAWKYLFSLTWYLLLSLITGLILTGLFPIIKRDQAEFIYRESFSPRTKTGKIIMKFFIGIGLSVGVLGASFGLHSEIPPIENRLILWIMAIGMYFFSVGLTFYTMYDYFCNSSFHWQPWGLWKKRKE